MFTLSNFISILRKQDFGYTSRDSKRNLELATLGTTTTWFETTTTTNIQSKSITNLSQILSLTTLKSSIERIIKGLKKLAKSSIDYG